MADLADSTFKSKLADLGGIPMPITPAEFGKFISADIDKWAKVIKFADIKPA
jgi:tripartite-type tricarboxylate transporter receptor subunit TctC